MEQTAYKKRYHGYTLLEIGISIAVFAIMIASATLTIQQVLNLYLTEQKVIDAHWQGMLGMSRMMRDFPTLRSQNDITTIDANAFTYIIPPNSSINFTHSGTTLIRNSRILADGINSLVLTTRKLDGTIVGSGAENPLMRYVTANINVTQGGTNYTLTDSVFLRNTEV